MFVFTYIVLCLANNNMTCTSRATEAIDGCEVRHHYRDLRTIATALRKILSS